MVNIRVDAYTATVFSPGPEALEWLVTVVPCKEQILVGREGKINRWKYDHGVAILDGKTTIACVRWGGNGDGTSIELKGSIAHETYEAVRAQYPGHLASRMDGAVDRTRPGLFDEAHDACMAIASATAPRVSSEPAGKGWDQPGRFGRTKYFGGRDSVQHVQLYEKGFERRDRGGMAESEVDLNHVRLEVSVHPSKKPEKAALALCTPLQLFGWSRWTRAMFEAFTGLKAAEVKRYVHVPDDERTYSALLQQYGAFIERMAEVEGPDFLHRLLRDHRALQDVRKGRYRSAA